MTYAKDMLGGGVSSGMANAITGAFNTIAAAGSTQADATLVTGTGIAVVTGADGTKGVVLAAGSAGDTVEIFNSSASTLKVYPPSGAAIAVVGTGLGSANAAFSHLTFKFTRYVCGGGTQWFALTSA
jgi:hypothetical protein